jgi:hypothetical protein
MRLLTKSRFKLGLECPNKLFYTKKKEYANSKNDDTFLRALALGGFQIEEYARLHYQDGILIEGDDGNYESLWNQTQNLLKQENIVIYEAAFLFENLFVRVDILKKTGKKIELIEVKAKSWDDNQDRFVGARDGLSADWKPYIFDVAFQKYVIQNCYPEWEITSYLQLADKNQNATVDGLNQLFRIQKQGDNRTGIKVLVNDFKETGNSVLIRKDVSSIIRDIFDGKHKCLDNKTFNEALLLLEKNYVSDCFSLWKPSYSVCKKCEFKANADSKSKGMKSGFEKCFKEVLVWNDNDFTKSDIFNIWNFRNGSKLLDSGIYFKNQLTSIIVGVKPEVGKISTTERQWIQIEKELNADDTIFVLKDELRSELDKLKFPLHFIDFETAIAALPFNSGRRPYEQIAFQFSHHTYSQNGKIDHQTEYINTEKGKFPNFDFVRNLKQALSNDDGTILRYSNHENTVLNQIKAQLLNSNEKDKVELINFIETITHIKDKGSNIWKGDRDMTDLLEIIKNFYYNPKTYGSNSIKDVLPASLKSSYFLQAKYSQPINEIELSSKNFEGNHVWINWINGVIQNPYSKLPSIYEGWSDEELDNVLSGIINIDEGGAALTAYGRLQYTDMTDQESKAIQRALLKYCELDTLAMIMIYEHLKEISA